MTRPTCTHLRDAALALVLVSPGGCVAGMMPAFERLVRER